jgi:hypothetical protein
LALAILRLLTVARNRRDRQFLIPSVGLAPNEGGYAREQIAPLFATAPANCRFMEATYAAAILWPKACYRVVIAGSRSLKDYASVAAVLDVLLRPEKGASEVVHGGAGGMDTSAGVANAAIAGSRQAVRSEGCRPCSRHQVLRVASSSAAVAITASRRTVAVQVRSVLAVPNASARQRSKVATYPQLLGHPIH